MAKNVEFDVLARDRASQTFDKVAQHSDGLGAKLGKFGVGAAKALGGFGLAAATAAGGFAAMGIKTAAANEQAQISFTTMLGSGQKAQAFLKQLQAFAAATPFEFPELQTAASSLISAGINANKVIPIMRTLGDVTAGMGTGSEGIQRATIALQQMNAAQKISAEDLNQLRDAGIPVYDLLSKALGKSKGEVVKLAQSGKLGKDALDKMMAALQNGKGLERFSGLMDKQSRSLSGLWSTFKDTLNMGLANAVKPLIPLLKDGLGKASEFLAKMLPKVSHGLLWIMTAAKGLYSILVKGDFTSAFRKAFNVEEDEKPVDFLFRLRDGFIAVVNFVKQKVIPAIVSFGGWLKNDLWPAIQKGYQTIMPALRQAFQIVASAFKSSGSDGKAFGDVLKKVGAFITGVLIPVVAKIATYALPLLAVGLRNNIMFVKVLWSAFQTLMGVVGRVISFILGRFADLAGMWANVLRALSHVPGFGWARDAANKLDRAAGRANALASAINRIPNSKNIVVTLHEQTVRVSTAGNAHGNIPKNAKGTRNFRGGLSWVGEQGPELVYLPKGSDVYSNGESMALARGGAGGGGGSSAGGDTFIVTVPPGTTRDQAVALLTEFKKIKRQSGVNLGLA